MSISKYLTYLKNTLGVLLALFLLLLTIGIAAIHLGTYKIDSPDPVVKEYFETLSTPYKIHRTQFQSRTLRYVETGRQDANAPIFLFIHGAPGSWSSFKEYLADYELRNMARLISVDRLGYGGSGLGDAETDIGIQAQAISHILQLYNAPQVYILSHSYGGPIAGKLTAEYTPTINGLIMCAPLNDPDNEPMKWYSKLADLKISRMWMPDFIDMATDEKMNHSASLQAIKSDWRRIKTLTIHIHGNTDNIAPHKVNIEFSKRHIDPQYLKTMVIDDCNHFLIWDRAAEMKSILVNMYTEDNVTSAF